MIRFLAMVCARNLNIFPAKNGISSHFSPHMLMSKRNFDYSKHGYGFQTLHNKNPEVFGSFFLAELRGPILSFCGCPVILYALSCNFRMTFWASNQNNLATAWNWTCLGKKLKQCLLIHKIWKVPNHLLQGCSCYQVAILILSSLASLDKPSRLQLVVE